MSFIPVDIELDEILVRFIFDKNFKRKEVDEANLITKDLFLPNKGGVSLQRGTYINENKCKLIAVSSFQDRIFSGFIVFTKQKFEEIKSQYKHDNRQEFEAIILSTPLDTEGSYMAISREQIQINDDANYCHSDLIYLNPAIEKDESVNTAIRSFSRKLSRNCLFIKDSAKLNEDFKGPLFKNAI